MPPWVCRVGRRGPILGLMINRRVSRVQGQAGGVSRMGNAKNEAKPTLRVNWTQEMDRAKGEELSPRRSSREDGRARAKPRKGDQG